MQASERIFFLNLIFFLQIYVSVTWYLKSAKYYFDVLDRKYVSMFGFFFLLSCSFVMTQKNQLSAAIS